MKTFIKGNCVGLPKPEHGLLNHKEYFDSIHILSQGDIDRGYYWCNNGNPSISLAGCEYTTPCVHYSRRCQTMKGKVTQPITFIKFSRILRRLSNKDYAYCYINFKGVKVKMKGFLSDDHKMVYFSTNSGYYKTKVYIDELGTLRGITENSCLSTKQRRAVTNFKE